MKINQISPLDNNFTQIIDVIALVPKKLYYYGFLPEKRTPTVAVVGSRKPTRYGTEVTTRIVEDLARRGVIVVSGMALGIDAIAHRAAIDAGGTTIAVQGNGLAELYPKTNRQLGEDIVKSGGAIISEYEPNTPPMKHRFLERNRLVAGLSDAVLVPEATDRSGSLNTVMHALEQNKEVFVVPGNITSPMSAGCNSLIKQGAHIATCAEDILEIIAPDLLQPQTSLALGDNPVQTKIIQLLQEGLRDGDEIRQRVDVDASEFSTQLTIMEISGQIRALGANQWTLR